MVTAVLGLGLVLVLVGLTPAAAAPPGGHPVRGRAVLAVGLGLVGLGLLIRRAPSLATRLRS